MDELSSPILDRDRPRSKSRLGRLVPWLVLAVVLGIVLLLILRLGNGGGGRHALALPPQAVGVATAATADMQVTDPGLGTVTSLASVTVQTQIAGILQTIGFHEGQIVHKGDFLAQIDPRPYQARLDQARGTLAHDQGLLRQAQTDEKRYATLNRQDSIGRQQFEDQQFIVQQYEGSVAADQGAIETQMVNLAFCHITSPITGRVGLRQVDAGNYVTTSLTNGIVVITQLDPISVIFTLPEDDIAAIQQQLAAGATLQAVAFDRSNSTQLATGKLETIDNEIDTTTGTVKLRALFDNPNLTLFPNQFVNIRLIVSTVHGAITVPNAALQTGAPGNFVYRVQPDSTVSVQVVKLGVADAEKTQILDGLAVGDKVVVDGADRLRDGMKVTLPGPTPPGAAGGAAPKSGWHHRKHPAAAESAN
jgi:multidrug efflux system membrane fusion protein